MRPAGAAPGEEERVVTSSLNRRITLANGVEVPQVGLGVFQVDSGSAQSVVEEALELGYRHIDTAAAYANEKEVGAALRASGLPRQEVFVTSKLRNGDQGRASALRAYEESCERLGLDFLDLYLIHWPNPAAGLWQESWEQLQSLYEAQRVRSIGVSNFLVEHLEELRDRGGLMPHANQIELHPTYQQAKVVEWCRANDVHVEAYSPLGQGADLGTDAVVEIASDLGVTPAQVVLRWHLDRGNIIIPKSVSAQRMAENSDLEAISFDAEQRARLDALESGNRIGQDPRTFSFSQIR